MNLDFDCIVIGSGMAGMTASIYLKRANKKVLLIEKEIPGGAINKSSTVQNFPGFTEISGVELAERTFKQVENLKVDYLNENVLAIENHDDYKTVITTFKKFTCQGIILATGRKPRVLRKKNEDKLIGNGISFCASCDGFLYKNKEVCVIGGGNSALEEALYLSKICSKVNIIHRKDKFTGDEYLIDQVIKNKKINIIYDATITEYGLKDDHLDFIMIYCNNKKRKILCSGVFLYIGYGPDTDLFNDLVEIDHKGYIIVDKNMKTSCDRIYACGDIIQKSLYQLVTAAAEGAVAANSFITKK